MKKNKFIVLSACICSVFVFCAPIVNGAEEYAGHFDKEAKFDIYFAVNDEEMNSIQNANIVEIVSISDIEFMVVVQKGRQAQDRKGFIRFDAIRAILPSDHWDLKEKQER